MFSSVSKFIDTAAVSESLAQARNAIVQSTTIDHIYCRSCGGQITIVTAYGKMVANNQCRLCGHLFCTNCLAKSKIGIPNNMLILEYRKPVIPDTPIVNEKQLLCTKTCMDVAEKACMDIFTTGMHDKFEECVNQYFESKETQIYLFPIPGSNPEDTTYRKALRIAVIAEAVADYTGFSLTFKAVKYAYYSQELVNLLMKGGLSAVLGPLMESLKDYGITGPTALLRIYYLGCKHTLEYKANVTTKSLLYQQGTTGVLLPECPVNILEYVSGFLSPAQWLYVAHLPTPHNSNEWSSWYFSRIIRRQGWTVLMCINETTQLPNGIKCPAFALVTRKRKSRTSGNELREAILVVRGSKSTMDWAINLEESLVNFSYTYKADCQETESSGHGNVITAHGKAHKGIYQGAMSILDAFSVREYLLRLLTKGYKITVVGHSLGAGTATLIAAEMRSTVIIDGTESKMHAKSSTASVKSGDRLSVSETNCRLAHNISAVVFASPAIITENLADAFSIDKLLINVVAGNDIIPRVSRKSFAQLAREVNDCTAAANAWTTADKADIWTYMKNIGKAQDIHATYGLKDEKTEAVESEKADPSAPVIDGAKLPPLEEVITDSKTSASTTSTSSSSTTSTASSMVTGLWSYAQNVVASVPTTTSSTASAPVAPSAPPMEEPTPAPSAPVEPVASAPPSKPAKPTKPEKPPKATPTATAVAAPAPPVVTVVDAYAVSDSGTKVETVASAKLQIDDPDEYIVTPSPIIHLYRENNGQVKSAVVTHTHRSFTHIDLVLEEIVEDHRMDSYRSLLTSAKYLQTKKQRTNNGNNSKKSSSKEEELSEELSKHIFNCAHISKDEKDDFMLDVDGKCEVDRTIVVRQSITNADFIEGVDNVQVAMAVQQSANDALDKANGVVQSAEAVAAAVDDAGASSLSPYTQHWKPCYLCGLDVTWPYMLHSDASRAMVTHTCGSCGEVVCSPCSPSGDVLPGDGINKYSTLSDLRIPLPSQGLFSPQRVCLACYFNSSHSTHEL